ncbi:MAG: methionyl-tRNA formyltransferase [Anaerolineales bacterium]|nr:methionyl-tRNA formyltransferase [Anaerolineales bacterium]
MGTPDFAVPTLTALIQHYSVVGVVTQPDRPAGRGRQLVAPPVKGVALSAGVPVIQPHRLREPQALAQVQAWAPELIVVAAFGQILRPAVLTLPQHGCVNVHASLLPRHRGATPIAAALLAGDAETGVTLMRMDPGLDTGPILAQRTTPIQPDDTTPTLSARIAAVGAELLIEALPAYLAGQLLPRPQDEALATYAPQLKKEDGRLDFTRPAAELARRVRALTPWPGAFALWPGPDGGARQLKVLRAAVLAEHSAEAGQVIATPRGPAVGTGSGTLLLIEVQPSGKHPMPAADFARGARGFLDSRLA